MNLFKTCNITSSHYCMYVILTSAMTLADLICTRKSLMASSQLPDFLNTLKIDLTIFVLALLTLYETAQPLTNLR